MKDKDVFEWSGNYMYTKSRSFIYLFFLCQHWRAGRNETIPTFSVICCFFHLLCSLRIKHLALPLLWRSVRFLLSFLPWADLQFSWHWTGTIRKVTSPVCKTELLLSGENRSPHILHVGGHLQWQGKHPGVRKGYNGTAFVMDVQWNQPCATYIPLVYG